MFVTSRLSIKVARILCENRIGNVLAHNLMLKKTQPLSIWENINNTEKLFIYGITNTS